MDDMLESLRAKLCLVMGTIFVSIMVSFFVYLALNQRLSTQQEQSMKVSDRPYERGGSPNDRLESISKEVGKQIGVVQPMDQPMDQREEFLPQQAGCFEGEIGKAASSIKMVQPSVFRQEETFEECISDLREYKSNKTTKGDVISRTEIWNNTYTMVNVKISRNHNGTNNGAEYEGITQQHAVQTELTEYEDTSFNEGNTGLKILYCDKSDQIQTELPKDEDTSFDEENPGLKTSHCDKSDQIQTELSKDGDTSFDEENPGHKIFQHYKTDQIQTELTKDEDTNFDWQNTRLKISNYDTTNQIQKESSKDEDTSFDEENSGNKIFEHHRSDQIQTELPKDEDISFNERNTGLEIFYYDKSYRTQTELSKDEDSSFDEENTGHKIFQHYRSDQIQTELSRDEEISFDEEDTGLKIFHCDKSDQIQTELPQDEETSFDEENLGHKIFHCDTTDQFQTESTKVEDTRFDWPNTGPMKDKSAVLLADPMINNFEPSDEIPVNSARKNIHGNMLFVICLIIALLFTVRDRLVDRGFSIFLVILALEFRNQQRSNRWEVIYCRQKLGFCGLEALQGIRGPTDIGGVDTTKYTNNSDDIISLDAHRKFNPPTVDLSKKRTRKGVIPLPPRPERPKSETQEKQRARQEEYSKLRERVLCTTPRCPNVRNMVSIECGCYRYCQRCYEERLRMNPGKCPFCGKPLKDHKKVTE